MAIAALLASHFRYCHSWLRVTTVSASISINMRLWALRTKVAEVSESTARLSITVNAGLKKDDAYHLY